MTYPLITYDKGNIKLAVNVLPFHLLPLLTKLPLDRMPVMKELLSFNQEEGGQVKLEDLSEEFFRVMQDTTIEHYLWKASSFLFFIPDELDLSKQIDTVLKVTHLLSGYKEYFRKGGFARHQAVPEEVILALENLKHHHPLLIGDYLDGKPVTPGGFREVHFCNFIPSLQDSVAVLFEWLFQEYPCFIRLKFAFEIEKVMEEVDHPELNGQLKALFKDMKICLETGY